MKINIATALKDFEGKNILNNETKKPIIARDIIAVAINTEDQQNRLTPEKKNQAFQIGIKLYGHDEVDFTVEQAAFIKERVGIFYSPLITGRINELFEKREEEKK
jgi:hypothetical protein